jgi:alpha-beta hydrolase superfamily lysophospholipase
MTPAARLIDATIPADPAGVVVVLHGGASRQGVTGVSPAQLSVLRMIPVASSIARAAAGRLAVLRLLNSRRGWDTGHTPVQDVAWALAEIAERFGEDVPVCLVGHSLGGRAALLSAGQPQVHGVVALAPWMSPTDSPAGARGTPVVIIHGDADRIASSDRSRQFAQRLGRETEVAYVSVAGGTHAMLRRRDTFDGVAARCTVWMLLGEAVGTIVQRIASGETSIEV